jgi:hypothetical protein
MFGLKFHKLILINLTLKVIVSIERILIRIQTRLIRDNLLFIR